MATNTSIATSFSKSLHGFQSHQSCLKCNILIHAQVLFPWHCPHGLQRDHAVIQTKSKFTNWSQGGTMQLHWSNLRKTYNTKTLLFKFHSIQLWTSYSGIICGLLLTNLISTIYYHYQHMMYPENIFSLLYGLCSSSVFTYYRTIIPKPSFLTMLMCKSL